MAIILDGKALAIERKELVRLETQRLVEKHQTIPHLVVILVGTNQASQSYVRGKEKACLKAKIKSTIILQDEMVDELSLLTIIDELNCDPLVHGILLQLPIPKHLNADLIMSRINPLKDVDGFTLENVGKLTNGQIGLVPCTPQGIMRLLEKYNIDPASKHCVVVGRSQIVGKPLASLLLKANGTVTICHSKTKNLKEICLLADILVAAIGKPLFMDDTFVKSGAVVIDVGISKVDEKIVGDVAFDLASKKASYITPVPGGVGPMTIACLLENTLTCYKQLVGENSI